MNLRYLLAAAVIGAALAHPAAQSGDKTLTGTITIKTGNGSTAVHGKSDDRAVGEFQFCIDQDRARLQKIDFTGPGRVTYRPAPRPPMPPGVVISGPENVESTLAVVAADGRTWLFVGKGQKPLVTPAAGAKVTTVDISLIRRTDWAAAVGPRRGISIEGCIAPGG